MFMLKKIAPLFLNPLSLCLGIFLLGLFCLWLTRRQRLGKFLVTLGTVLLFVLSSAFFSAKVLTPLEYRYPALLYPDTVPWEGDKTGTLPRWIVVLGGGHVSDPRLPVNSQLSEAALSRLVEGVRLYKAIPHSKLLLSGGVVFDPVPEAQVMAQIALLLGVKPQDIVLEPNSRDTEDEAALIAGMLAGQKLILVTSAAHMTRAMALFAKRGLQPIPAPADYRLKASRSPGPGLYFPGAGHLGQVETALHEYLGLAWAWLRGAI
jgi:uncharacterized SAM-binding protein YcdF (DUF218 family)